MADLIITERSNIVAIADAVRNNTGETKEITIGEIISGINYIGSNANLDTSDATAKSGDILSGKTAYVDGEKITGTFTIDSELTSQDNLISQITTALANKSMGDVNIDEELTTQDNLIAQIQTALNNKINGS